VSAPERATPEVSLIVCTRDRAARLQDCLRALRALRPAVAWELILVDNGSSDDTARLLAEFAQESPTPVAVVREPSVGLANARNAAVRVARGAVIVFIDDDCYPEPDLLDRWAEQFEDDTIGFASGRVLLHDPADAPVTVQKSTAPIAIAARSFVAPGVVKGANMAFRRSALFAAGGFDPALGPGRPFNCEDVDMAARVSAIGFSGAYAPAPTVRHHHGRQLAREVNALQRSYAHGSGAYYASLLLRWQTPRALASHLRGSWRATPVRLLCWQLVGALQYLAYRALHWRAQRPLRRISRP
jgi:GT2 family glycosyltransferase